MHTIASISYIIASFFTLIAATSGGIIATNLLFQKKKDAKFERLSSIAGGLGLFFFTARIISIPLWIGAISSLAPLVPGAMCALGVHNAIGKVAWCATFAKLILPGIYISWLIRNKVDALLPDRPYLENNLKILIVGAFFALFESILDTMAFSKISPIPVSCCGSFFNSPEGPVPSILQGPSLPWIITLFISLLLLIFLRNYRGKTFDIIKVPVFLSGIFSLVLFFHSHISPYILIKPKPGFRCIFCLLSDSVLISAGFFSILMAFYLLIVPSWDIKDISWAFFKRLIFLPLFLIFMGFFLIFIRMLI